MARTAKKDENKNMIRLLKNVKNVAQNMLMEIILAEENEREFLPQMLRFNKMNAALSDEKKRYENNTIYIKIYNSLLEYYVFSNQGAGISLKSDALLKEKDISIKIKEVIAGKKQFKEFEQILDAIEMHRRKFTEDKAKLKEIRGKNQYVELEEVFDYVGTLAFDNTCTVTRFVRVINQKIKDLDER